jgi:prepilin-type N-terminal cleavage/methylation domain-containing protein/prepilin-type processing-associated H-X9-DG protein
MSYRVNVPARRRGFTLVELLVVITIIGILIALLLPAVQTAREAARRVQCSNNMRQFGLAALSYENSAKAFPSGWNTWGAGWSLAILPYADQASLYDTVATRDMGSDMWTNGSANQRACETVLPAFQCPCMTIPQHIEYNGIKNRFPACYRGNSGSLASADDTTRRPVVPSLSLEDVQQNGIFFACSRVGMSEITDGTSHTFLFGESRPMPEFVKDDEGMDFWYIGSPQMYGCSCSGGDTGTEFNEFVGSTLAPLNAYTNDVTISAHLMELSFGSYHSSGGANFTMCDGSVQNINDEIDPTIYRGLGSRNGEENTGEF